MQQSTYNRLPDKLKFIGNLYKDRNADVVLLSTITALSSLAYFMKGLYHDKYQYPNLNAFIIAPPAQGKGNAQVAERICSEYEYMFKSGYSFDNQSFRHIIAGNNSYANLIMSINQCSGRGLIFETEGDVVSQNFKNDWGDYTTVLRQMFHNETVRYERKTGSTAIKIKEPKLALLLTMTPGQLQALVQSRENGMFSRVLFYHYNDIFSYKSPRPNTAKTSIVDKAISDIASHYLDLHSKSSNKEIEFDLSEDQWKYFDTVNKARFSVWPAHYGEENRDIITRLAIIMFKIAMVLTSTRLASSQYIKKVKCKQDDLETAKEITNVLFYHALSVIKLMPKPRLNTSPEPPLLREILLKLEVEFTTKEFVTQAIEHGVKERTANRWLTREDFTSFKKVQRGKFKKV